MRNLFRLLILIIALNILACSDGGHSDLDEFISNSGNGLRGKVDPLPVVKPYTHFAYEASDMLNPFMPRKSEHVLSVNNELQPDLRRRKEVLENFPLKSLEMVGTLQQYETIYALIRAPDGTLHRVETGNYIGQNFGRIDRILESEVKLSEIVQDEVSEWMQRVSTLMLKD